MSASESQPGTAGAKGRKLLALDRSEKQISRYSLCQIRWQQHDRSLGPHPRRTQVPSEAAVSSNPPLSSPGEAAQLSVLHTGRWEQLKGGNRVCSRFQRMTPACLPHRPPESCQHAARHAAQILRPHLGQQMEPVLALRSSALSYFHVNVSYATSGGNLHQLSSSQGG